MLSCLYSKQLAHLLNPYSRKHFFLLVFHSLILPAYYEYSAHGVRILFISVSSSCVICGVVSFFTSFMFSPTVCISPDSMNKSIISKSFFLLQPAWIASCAAILFLFTCPVFSVDMTILYISFLIVLVVGIVFHLIYIMCVCVLIYKYFYFRGESAMCIVLKK